VTAEVATAPRTARPRRDRAARDRLLFRRYRNRADASARETLVQCYLPLARHIAARFRGGGEPYEDLVQVASLALVRAIDRFEPDRGAAFSSFAMPTISGELKRHFRDKTWAVRVPRSLQDFAVAVSAARERLSVDLGRSPTLRELARHLGIDEHLLLDALMAGDAYTATSLETPVLQDAGSIHTLGDTLAYHERGYDLADERASLERLLDTLTSRDREIVRLRFEEDMTQREIGQRMGISQMHVSRVLRAAIAALAEAAATAMPDAHARANCR
jgi:RNA polymerase sigma-B factor